MQRLQAFKYELMPTGEQQRDMRRFSGSCRFVFNKALAMQTANHEAGNKHIRYEELANLLPAWKSEFPWLKEAPSQALQHALKNVDRAFVNFFEKRADYPRFKKRGYGDSFRFPQGFKLDQATVGSCYQSWATSGTGTAAKFSVRSRTLPSVTAMGYGSFPSKPNARLNNQLPKAMP